jgi:hypothetical protein
MGGLTFGEQSGSTADEVALVGEDAVTGTTQVQVKDLGTGAVLSSLFYGDTHELHAVLAPPSYARTAAAEIAVLGRERLTGDYRIAIKDAESRSLIRNVYPALPG